MVLQMNSEDEELEPMIRAHVIKKMACKTNAWQASDTAQLAKQTSLK